MIAQAPYNELPSSCLLSDYFRDVYCAARREAFSPTTQVVYLAAFSKLREHLARPATIGDLTSETISSFMLWLVGHGRSPATANSYRHSILAMWKFACERGHVEQRPDLSIVREYRSHDIEEHWRARSAAELQQPLSPQMTLRSFALEHMRTRDLGLLEMQQIRGSVGSLDRAHSRLLRIEELSEHLIDDWTQQRLESGIGDLHVWEQRKRVLRLWQAAFEAGLISTPPSNPPPPSGQRTKAKARAAPVLPSDASAIFGEQMRISHLIAYFLNWQDGRVVWARIRQARSYLGDFERQFGHMTIAEFRPGACARVDLWIKSHKGWHGCRASVVCYLKQLFSWGATGLRNSQGFYVTSPIASLERPKHGTRVAYFTAEQVDAILRHGSEQFRTAFRALLATGCRPAEIGGVRPDDIEDDDGELFWLVHHKNEHHTGQKRRIYLTDEAQQITRQQMKDFPSGRLFRSNDNANHEGQLSGTYLNHALRKICRRPDCRALGLDEYKQLQRSSGGRLRLYKYVAYTARHTFAVRYLTGFYKDSEGNPIILGYAEIAQYMGNSAAMVEKIYGHLVTQKKFLSARLRGVPLKQITDQRSTATIGVAP